MKRKAIKKPDKQKPHQLPKEALDNIPVIQLTCTRESMWLTRFDRAGVPTALYPVAAGDVAAAFESFGASTGLLHEWTLFWQSRGQQVRIGAWLPPEKHTLNLNTGRKVKTVTIPLPGFVFAGEGKCYSIFAATQRPRRPGDRLYHAPLSNVDSNGNICAGNVNFPTCTPDTFEHAAQLFFESEFNADLSTDRISDDGSLLEFLIGLNGAARFPQAQLRQAITIGQLIGDRP